MSRGSHAASSLGQDIYQTITDAKVLMVGAGGIGCELLKNLVLMNFGEIHIVDLDTIDLSNLNRQFLFGMEHIKKPKAFVAKETASKFNPNVKIVAYHDNIKDEKFNIKWFKEFDIVYNALDNLDARRYVNRMCLTANVPLVESGTAGFDGQVQVIVGGKTECYDCNPKPTTKSFPVCTIRSTPSQPIHCIVWAKSYLFYQIFEAQDDEDGSVGIDDGTDDDNVEEKEKLAKEANELKTLRDSIFSEGFFKQMLNKVFKTDIERLASMETMWKTRKKPAPLDYEVVKGSVSSIDAAQVLKQDHKVWNVQENLAVLQASLHKLQSRLMSLREIDASATILFDKDDQDTLDFVASASNIRSAIFSIETKSEFEIKQIAGSIIPAIATTNAIIAGICVLQSLKIIQGKLDEARMVFLSRQPNKVFSTEKLRPPNPYCVVSGVSRTILSVNPTRFTLGNLVEDVIKNNEYLNYESDVTIISSTLLYDSDFDDNMTKSLGELGVRNGSFLTVIDDEDDGRVNLEIYIEENLETEKFELSHVPAMPQKLAPRSTSDGEEDNKELSIEQNKEEEEEEEAGQKRKLEDGEINTPSKRQKVNESDEMEDDVVIIDDNDDIIELD